MDAWIEFARGPLFRICAKVCVLGLVYRLGVTVAQIVAAWRRAGDRRLPVADIAVASVKWIVPVRLLNQRPLYSIGSIVFHLGVVIVPLFLAGHVVLLSSVLPGFWPTLPPLAADVLTVAALVAMAVMLVARVAWFSTRALSRTQDWSIMVLLLAMVAFGFLGANPHLSPFPARTMVLLHMLLGNLVLVLIPLSKIAHCVLFPLTQLVFQLGWHFPADSGRHVAIALAKENEPI
jgi:hypothetical protein